ncbi:MAG: hypothetical protein CM1200mP41_22410 [Gammaproteobacteria bacterium]|nr:MAG: hypothetical protein CM1200mP41_22410 [Gammaproteobacteria bacterium]
MRLNDLKPADGSRPKRTRRGRGPGSGMGRQVGAGSRGPKSGQEGVLRSVLKVDRCLCSGGYRSVVFAP